MSPPQEHEHVVVSSTPSRIGRTTSHIVRLLTWAMALLTLFVVVLTVSYFRQGNQISRLVDKSKDQSDTIKDLSSRLDDDSKVIGQVRDLAVIFAEFGNPNADREALRKQLNDLAAQLQQAQEKSQGGKASASTTTTTTQRSASPTTSTTAAPRPPSTTTTTTAPALCVPGVVCLRRPLALAWRRFHFGW